MAYMYLKFHRIMEVHGVRLSLHLQILHTDMY